MASVKLLTSSEVELKETSLLAVKSSIRPSLLTSSEVELMETLVSNSTQGEGDCF